ncbi:hypothetical protein FNF27_07457 [Cafeteria roenbergensis]|uniref:Uncharacterized protein n=1 Tax=Cafeteria roenbergensis TaxID=33653 RepID=A0A5A8DNA3_CAFRO|nr:hypothetical protein FNF27_07457 [Cafeteria roenbergensis]
MSRRVMSQPGELAEDEPWQVPASHVELGKDQALPDSALWALQDSFYKEMGAKSWSQAVVPNFVTSNCHIARCYANMIMASATDWARTNPQAPGEPGDVAPVVIVEVGCGHGRLGFMIVRHLLAMRASWPPSWDACALAGGRPFLYVLADLAERNVRFIERFAPLRAMIDAGWVDSAVFDAENDRTLRLRASGRTLSARDFSGASGRGRLLVAVANYVVDTLAQDAYRVRDGALERAHLSIAAPLDADGSDPLLRASEKPGRAAARLLASSRTVSRLSWQWRWTPTSPAAAAAALAADGHPLSADVLLAYAALFGGRALGGTGSPRDASFLVPLGGLRLLDSLRTLGSGRCVFLLGDKAYSEEAELVGLRTPHIALHGSFSFMANLHGMMLGARALGGEALATPLRDGFKCACLLVGTAEPVAAAAGPAADPAGAGAASGAGDAGGASGAEDAAVAASAPVDDAASASSDARQAWRCWFGSYCPEAFSTLQRAVYECDTTDTCSLRTAVAVLRLSGWEPDVAHKFRITLVTRAETASPRMRRDLAADIVRCGGAIFPLQPAKDILFELGRALVNIGRYGAATVFFEESRWWCGEHHVAWYNMGLCHHRSGRFRQAAACHRRSLELDPTYGLAREWLRHATARIRDRRAVEQRLASAPDDDAPPLAASGGASLAERASAAVRRSAELARSKGVLPGEAALPDVDADGTVAALPGTSAQLAAEGGAAGTGAGAGAGDEDDEDDEDEAATGAASGVGDAAAAAAGVGGSEPVPGAADAGALTSSAAAMHTTVTVACVGAFGAGDVPAAGVAADPFSSGLVDSDDEDEAAVARAAAAGPSGEGAAGPAAAEAAALAAARRGATSNGEALAAWGAGVRHPSGIGAAWAAGREVAVCHVRVRRGASLRQVLGKAREAAVEARLAVVRAARDAAVAALEQADATLSAPSGRLAIAEAQQDAVVRAVEAAEQAGADTAAAADEAKQRVLDMARDEADAAAADKAMAARFETADATAPRGEGPDQSGLLLRAADAALSGAAGCRVILAYAEAVPYVSAVLAAADGEGPGRATVIRPGVEEDAMDATGRVLRVDPAVPGAMDQPAPMAGASGDLRERLARGCVVTVVLD